MKNKFMPSPYIVFLILLLIAIILFTSPHHASTQKNAQDSTEDANKVQKQQQKDLIKKITPINFFIAATPSIVKDTIADTPLAGLTIMNDDGLYTPLMQAAMYTPYGEVIDLLIKAGSEKDKIVRRRNGRTKNLLNGGYSALHLTVEKNTSPEALKTLLRNKLNPDLQTPTGVTALMLSAQQPKKTEFTRVLLQAQANPNIQDSTGKTALYYAASAGALEQVELLLTHGANPKVYAPEFPPLYWAIYNGKEHINETRGKNKSELPTRLAIAKLLVEAGAQVNPVKENEPHPLLAAIIAQDHPTAEYLLAKGAKPQDKVQATEMLISALQPADIPDYKPLPANSEVVKFLLSGLDPNIKGQKYGYNLLQKAILYGAGKDSVKVLLQAGADIKIATGSADSPLVLAAKSHSDDGEIINLLVKNGLQLQKTEAGADARLAIETAVSYRHYNVASALIENGADFTNVINIDGNKDLLNFLSPEALKRFNADKQALIIRWATTAPPEKVLTEYLFYKFTDVNTLQKVLARAQIECKPVKDQTTGELKGKHPQWTNTNPLKCALVSGNNPEFVHILVKAGISPVASTDNPLVHSAAINPNPEMLKALLVYKPSLEYTNIYGVLPIHAAAYGTLNRKTEGPDSGLQQMRLLLEAGANPNAASKKDNSNGPLINAIKCGSLNKVNLLLQYGAKLKNDEMYATHALNQALESGEFAIARRLLELPINFQYTNRWGKTFLYTAAETRKISQHMDIFEKILKNIDPQKHDLTAILQACAVNSYPVVYRLLEAGVPIDAGTGNKSILIMALLREQNPDLEILKLLIKHGADINGKMENYDDVSLYGSNPPVVKAALVNNAEAVRILLEAGANSNEYDTRPHALLGTYLSSRKGKGVTPDSLLPMVKLMLEHGADINALGKDGYSPLLIMLSDYSATHPQLLQLLIDSGATINKRFPCHWTPLTLAARYGQDDTYVKILLEAGADPLQPGKDNKTALEHALDRGNRKAVFLLETASKK